MNIDNNYLEELGLGSIPQDEKDRMLADIRETLADRIGAQVETRLDEAKLDEFDGVIGQNDQAATNAWLENNLPDYKQIVEEEMKKIRADIEPQVAPIVQKFAVNPDSSTAVQDLAR